ncbi:hypothetical protein O3W44_22155 [Pantoea sp. LMR881]|uniref:hypothetical protein n=1 Tax=Pantoea sp. LMR881 TaxID=3014336 RepID=UPI0022AFB273|nr:hypothetical protein [Pantoea sp. LMR881]MCZ4061236.1 hypothetical protein [Pantoea sp. LMR881]
MSDLEIVNDGNQNGVGDVATIAPVENLDAAEDMKEEEVAQVPFLRKAMVLGSPALVQSILTMPDTFVMPGYTLVALEENTVCEPGMLYDEATGTFSVYVPPEPEAEDETAEETVTEQTTAESENTEAEAASSAE